MPDLPDARKRECFPALKGLKRFLTSSAQEEEA